VNTWFRFFLTKAISQRRGRFLLSAAAVMLSVAVVTALATISLGVREKIGAELRQYGANMIVTPGEGGAIDAGVGTAVRGLGADVRDASFQVYGTARVRQVSVEITGIEPDKMTGYRVQGSLPRSADELMVGVNLKEVLQVRPGERVRFEGSGQEYRVTGTFEKGSDEDGTIVIPLAGAQQLLGMTGRISAVLLNADTARLRETAEAITRQWPFLEVKTLRQVAVAEERILSRIQLLMLIVTAVVLFSSVVALGSTMGANVIERREEIGLLKAIGATRGDIRRFFMSEAALAGLAGSFTGYAIGTLAAETVSRAAFGSFVPLSILVAPGALTLGVTIAAAATYFPVRDAMKIVPAQILRGE